jgi:hypothetical protein
MWLKSTILTLFVVLTAVVANQAYGNRPRGVPADSKLILSVIFWRFG